MAESSYDCIVIGSGPGGYVAAIRAAQLGMKTAVVEKDVVGGRCLNYACIPAKAVLRSADILSEVREAESFGIKVSEPEIDFGAIFDRREKVIKTLTGGVAGLFKKNTIDLIEGEASLVSGGVRVGDQEIKAGKVIIATGSIPKPIPGTQFGGRIIGTEEAWAFTELPGSLAVVGAGASGSEIASAYARLGSEVHLFEGLDRVLPSEDPDISKLVERGLKKQGMKVHTKTLVENVQGTDTSVTFTAAGEQLEVDYLVIAAGRGPDVEALGLEAAGVKLDDRGLIDVDAALRTSVDGVYAIGDLVKGPALAHKASDEGIIAAEDAAGQRHAPARARRHPARDVLHAERRLVRPDRAAGQGPGLRRRRRQAAVRRRSAPARSTATARAWSRSSARRSTASCWAATSSARARPSSSRSSSTSARSRAASPSSRASCTATRRCPRP
jgi:dihydrolipoamide dehydrogenase